MATQKGAKSIAKDKLNHIDLPRVILEGSAATVLAEPDRFAGAKTVYQLEGLGCVQCANKIEAEVRRLAEVDHASLDFVGKKLALQTVEGVSISLVNKKINEIVSRIEPGVKVLAAEQGRAAQADHVHGANEFSLKKQGAKFVIGGAFFAAAIIFTLPLQLKLTLYLLSYFIVGGSVIWRALQGIIRGQVFSEHFLMTVATAGAFAVGAYSEGAAVMLFYLVGEIFQDMAVDHSRKSITALMDIRPDYANLKIGEGFSKVPPEEVGIGDVIMVKPGERIPLDGKVIAGNSWVDTSALTGESVPRELAPGSEALSGFINNNGVLTIEVRPSP